MHETMIGKFTDKFAELGDVRKLLSWVELYSLAPRKRVVTWSNLVFNPNLTIWVFSSNSGVYFQQKDITDNTGIRRIIYQGRAFLSYDAEHEYNIKEGMRIIGQNYGIKNIEYEKHYIPLMEQLILLENEENKPRAEMSEAVVMEIKQSIKQIIDR